MCRAVHHFGQKSGPGHWDLEFGIGSLDWDLLHSDHQENDGMVPCISWLAVLISTVCTINTATLADYWTDPYDVVWTTPSKDSAGSMPMGNGEVGINLWVEENGDLNFYISRSDSFSEIGRLLKIGQVKVAITPNPFATGAKFEQRLHLHDGVCEITAGDGEKKVTLKVFVDPDSPVVNVIGESASPVTVKATAITWRTERRTIAKAEQNSAWTMRGAPFDLVESADVSLSDGSGTIGWYHRNERSIVPSTIQLQSLTSTADKLEDPLLHRTFGMIITGLGFRGVNGDALHTGSPSKAFSFSVMVPCEQSADVESWMKDARLDEIPAPNAHPPLQRTTDWWHQFWDRSWVVTNAGEALAVPVNKYDLRLGVDSNGQNEFPGELPRTATYNRALSADEIAKLAAQNQDQPPAIAADRPGDFSHSFTLSAWINADRLEPGRIFDKLTAGSTDGFLFDTHPGNTLRLIVGNITLSAPPGILTAGSWHHVAATVDATDGLLRIYLDGKVVAQNLPDGVSPIARGYTLQRYVQACGGRGNYPIKFNGGIFTVEPKHMGESFNADYRAWGECYWWQNTRHMYHPMLASGDIEMMDPLFNMYEAARPICEARAMLYHHARGCYFPETMTSWGTYSNGDYGWNRTGHVPADVLCPYWQYAWNQGPELVGLLLDRWDYTNDPAFLKKMVLPMAESVLGYFDTRFVRLVAGKIVLKPTQSVETYWKDVINDMPSVAGLNDITTRLCALPVDLTTSEQRTFFAHMKAVCPAVPVHDKTANGKPIRSLAPAQEFNPSRSNCENPELYAVWPFRLFGIGKPGLEEAVAAYDNRINHLDVGWGYDGNCAALLGLTDEAARILKIKCANSRAGYRWPATWGPNFDWLPDQNHGGNLLETTQLMLLQCDGSKIRLLPAWPKQWDVSFKLHATGNTVVECVYRSGKIVKLEVTPKERAQDVVMP
jgi:hypothetical protein